MPNHLIHETSPYLLQHADNPVDWHPWNAETLQLAREQDKPILLSIGYSACHWCHVMAHESFEDEAVAAVMNEHFINIKVDREERPDLDQIYQNAHYLLSQRSGGWPLTMFLSPDGTPFYSGTYFPKQARYGLPGFPGLLLNIAKAYKEKRAELADQGKQLISALASWQPEKSEQDSELDVSPIKTAILQLNQTFDRVNGGFGDAPKFLHPAELDLLLRHAEAAHDEQARFIALFTLQQMALGGLYDQLGGGFCRYSVDASWDIPHFEKMLYDNGLLLGVYCDAWLSSNDSFFARVVEQTAAWVMREMQSPQGGYYASLDADSEHEEGKFYVWQRNEIRDLLGTDEFEFIKPHYGLDSTPNFENHAWNLRVSKPLSEIAQQLKLSEEQALMQLSAIKAKLFAAREQRVRPGRDEKILGSWNGLMIAGMAKAARTFNRADWLQSARQAMDFVRNTLWQDGKLLATHKDGKTHLNAYLDDHAFLLNAALQLLQTEYRSIDMAFAAQLADALLERFEDKENGGFFFTSHDHETLIQRNKTGQDNATPSGNGIAAQALVRLAELTGDTRYSDAAERCLKLYFPVMQKASSQFCSLCTALDETLRPPSLLVLCGADNETAAWRAAVAAQYRPGLMIVTLTGNETGLPAPLDKPRTSTTTAWLCRGTQCLPPITKLVTLLEELA
ncbi:MAG: thioredoxin domain-containing protein [Gammaproteobacteria bacterium]|nr:thioredoxin domain-containing protein [Gammaproteobacteria bacterium]MBU1480521.1 thioredoxin domain-containing protein [Gammaproteobacteria bacterium]